MTAKWMVAATASLTLGAASLGGCVFGKHPPPPDVGNPLTTCPKDDPCSKIKNRRQLFDQHANRYYYFDQTTGRYYWENGEPRFPMS